MTKRRTRSIRLLALLVVGVLLSAACGSRLPDETIEAIDANVLRGGGGGGTGTAVGTSDGFGTGTTPVDQSGGGEAVGGQATAPGGEEVVVEEGGAPAPGAGGGGGADPAAPQQAAGGGEQQAANCRPGDSSGPGVSQREINVSSIVTDSGPLPGATAGAYRSGAAHFAMINAMGGVCGRKLNLTKGDDGLDPARGRGEFLRLEPKSLAFVSPFSVADSGYIDQIEATGVPWVGITVDPAGRQLPTVWPKGRDDMVHTGPFVYWKQQNPNVKKSALLYADVGGVSSNVGGLAKAMEKAGFELVMPPTAVGVADPDYTGTVRNLQDRGVEFVYLFSFEVNMHVRFIRNMNQQGYDPPIKGANIAFNDRFSSLLEENGDGWQNHQTFLPFLDPAERGRSKAVADFLDWNQRVFPGGSLDLFAIDGWGKAAYFVEALRKLGPDVDREGLLKALDQVEVYNDAGLSITTNPSTGDNDGCFAIAKHEGGSWRRAHPAGGGFECGLGEKLKYK